jgi:hypothetical protein
VFDPTLGNTYSSSTENFADGGTYLRVENPAISATITINSVNVSIVPIFFSEILGFNNGNGSEQFDETDTSPYNFVSTGIINHAATLPATITVPFTYTVDPSTDILIGSFELGTVNQEAANGYLSPTTLTVSIIPEASTWAMMLIGFAGLSLAGFRSARRPAGLATSPLSGRSSP